MAKLSYDVETDMVEEVWEQMSSTGGAGLSAHDQASSSGAADVTAGAADVNAQQAAADVTAQQEPASEAGLPAPEAGLPAPEDAA